MPTVSENSESSVPPVQVFIDTILREDNSD